MADIGMGSGILSILAKKLGASEVYGCDIDETVIDVAKENALKNSINKGEIVFEKELEEAYDERLWKYRHPDSPAVLGHGFI